MPRYITRTHTEALSPGHLSYTVHTEGMVGSTTKSSSKTPEPNRL